jgi:hypothetical protein
MTDTSALTNARNQYLTAVERSLIANEAFLLSTLLGCSDADKQLAILERSDTGLAVRNTMAEYLKARDAWWHANQETTP